MVTRRKYKVPQAFRDGGRVLADVGIEPDERLVVADLNPPAPPSPQPSVAPPPPIDDPLAQALQAVRRADELQRRIPKTIEQHIDSIPNLSPHKRAFLKANPAMLDPNVLPVMTQHYQAALRDGVPDDTPAMNERILVGVSDHFRQRLELTSADARPTPENLAAHQAVADLEREAEDIAAKIPASRLAHEPLKPTPRLRGPITAPVSREVPTMQSGQRYSQERTLTAEERQIAHISFPHLSQREAELSYLHNRTLMRQMKADGRIQGDR